MTPTPDQVAQWAREAGIEISAPAELPAAFRVNVRHLSDLHRLVTRSYNAGRAEQAEADAKLCDGIAAIYWAKDYAIESLNCEECATAIRANAPKVTT